MDKIAELRNVVEDPYTCLRKMKEQDGRKMVGYVCSLAPEELIWAAGAAPVRLFGSDAGITRADLHLQAYCCSLVRGILADGLDGRLDVLDGIIFPHTCDTIQRLSDIWRINLPQMFHLDVVLPVKLTSPSAKQYYIDVLNRFSESLQKALGCIISPDDLGRAMKLFNAIRVQMQRLYDLRQANPEVVSGADYHTLVRAAMIMDREKYLDALTDIVTQLSAKAQGQAPSRARRLMLTGGVCSTPDIYGAIESAGGTVVGDDLCTGSRYFEGLIDEKLPPVEALAKRYMERSVCPAKHRGLTDRGETLLRKVKESRAEGVIFLLLKFCDPHAFDYPYIKAMLERENIPSLLLEVEDQSQTGGQLETRLETFIQIL